MVLPPIKIFLVIFVYSANQNSRFFTRDRKYSNYLNGVGFVSLLQFTVLADAYLAAARLLNWKIHVSPIIAAAVYIVLFFLDQWWLIGRRAGIDYLSDFPNEPAPTRKWLKIWAGVTTVFAFAALLVLL